MRCPACNNTKEFQYFYIGWSLRNVKVNDSGEVEDSDMQDSDIDSVKEVICSMCGFDSLPEVFSMSGYEEWREVELESDGRYVLLEAEIVDYWRTIVVGQIHFDANGIIYAKLYKIHFVTSVDELPEMLVDDHRAVRNSATEKMKELML